MSIRSLPGFDVPLSRDSVKELLSARLPKWAAMSHGDSHLSFAFPLTPHDIAALDDALPPRHAAGIVNSIVEAQRAMIRLFDDKTLDWWIERVVWDSDWFPVLEPQTMRSDAARFPSFLNGLDRVAQDRVKKAIAGCIEKSLSRIVEQPQFYDALERPLYNCIHLVAMFKLQDAKLHIRHLLDKAGRDQKIAGESLRQLTMNAYAAVAEKRDQKILRKSLSSVETASAAFAALVRLGQSRPNDMTQALRTCADSPPAVAAVVDAEFRRDGDPGTVFDGIVGTLQQEVKNADQLALLLEGVIDVVHFLRPDLSVELAHPVIPSDIQLPQDGRTKLDPAVRPALLVAPACEPLTFISIPVADRLAKRVTPHRMPLNTRVEELFLTKGGFDAGPPG